MRKKDRSLLVALVLQVAALAFVALLYLYLRGVATDDRSPVIPLPVGGAEESPAGRDPEAPRTDTGNEARLGSA